MTKSLTDEQINALEDMIINTMVSTGKSRAQAKEHLIAFLTSRINAKANSKG